MVAAPQQARPLGLATPHAERRIDPVAAFGGLVDNAQDVAAPTDQGEIGNRNVVAYVDHRVQPGHRRARGWLGAVGTTGRSLPAGTTRHSRQSTTAHSPPQRPASYLTGH